MAYKHLGQQGLEQLLALLKAEFGLKVDKVDGFGLSKNDFTDELKSKLENIEAEANKYVHATHTAKDLALYKVQVDGEGHVASVEAVTKDDITGLGIPGQDTTYVVATQTSEGLMSADDKKKIDGIEEGANKYIHATHTPAASGFYKITVDGEGHVSAVTAVSKEDIVALGIPAQDTTYAEATQETPGLMSAADKAKVDGLGALASKSIVAESDLDTALAEKVNAAADGNHSHSNKDLLDTYTQTEENLADAVAKKHEHANKAELDLIASGDKAKWDKAVEDLAGEITRATKAEEANAAAASAAQSTADGAATQAGLNKSAIETLNGDENTAGSVAKTVKDYVDVRISSAYKASGSVEFESLPEASAENEGKVYNMLNDFTTDADFVEGAGKKYKAGTNVVIVEESEGVFKYDVLAMSFDGFVQEADITEFTESDIQTAWNNVFTPAAE